MDVRTNHIGDIVAEDFRTASVFNKYGLDFCCNGGKTVADACQTKGVDAEKVYKEIETMPAGGGQSVDFRTWPLDLLADYIEKTHHRYAEEKMPIIKQFLAKICQVHGAHHPELFEVNDIFNDVSGEFARHMKKEELTLFPFIRNMVRSQLTHQALKAPRFGSVENPVDMMMHDHTAQGEALDKIAELTNGYTTPADGCNTYNTTLKMLEDFEQNTHTHIHLENNILFPKAIALEKELEVVQ